MMRARRPGGAPSSSGESPRSARAWRRCWPRKSLACANPIRSMSSTRRFGASHPDRHAQGQALRRQARADQPAWRRLHNVRRACALLESVPIASLGGYKVITVNYRMAPEATHPAAVEDVATVYRELLKSTSRRISAFTAVRRAARSPRKRPPGCRRMACRRPERSAFSARERCASAQAIRHGSRPISTAPSLRRRNRRNAARHHPRLFRRHRHVRPDHLARAPSRCYREVPAHAHHHRHARDGHEPGDLHQFAATEGRRAFHSHRRRRHGPLLHLPVELPEARDAYQVIVSFFRENLK